MRARASGVHGAQHRAVREILGRLQQELYLRRTQNHREFSLVPGQRDAIDADGKMKGVGVEKSESANGLYVGRKRHALLFDQEHFICSHLLYDALPFITLT